MARRSQPKNVSQLKDTKEPALPTEILASDLAYPKYDNPDDKLDYTAGESGRFEMWYTEAFGWCIPTLVIKNAGRADTRRTYAVTLAGNGCRIGHGPHVKKTVTVYVRKNRVAALQKFLDLLEQGKEMAGETRDRISSRRMNTSMRRRSLWGF